MKFFSIILFVFVINFSTFAFIPAESKSNLVVSENNTSKSETKKSISKEKLAQVNAKELLEKLEANKSKMSLKERLATKLITKKLKKIENKNVKEVKDSGALSGIFRLIGTILVILGIVGLFVASVGAGVGTIIVGIIFILLPAII